MSGPVDELDEIPRIGVVAILLTMGFVIGCMLKKLFNWSESGVRRTVHTTRHETITVVDDKKGRIVAWVGVVALLLTTYIIGVFSGWWLNRN